MSTFTYACVRLTENKLKDIVVKIEDIFLDKKVKTSINPTTETDFNTNHEYRIFWRSCLEKNCTPFGKCCDAFKKAYLVAIGSK